MTSNGRCLLQVSISKPGDSQGQKKIFLPKRVPSYVLLFPLISGGFPWQQNSPFEAGCTFLSALLPFPESSKYITFVRPPPPAPCVCFARFLIPNIDQAPCKLWKQASSFSVISIVIRFSVECIGFQKTNIIELLRLAVLPHTQDKAVCH